MSKQIEQIRAEVERLINNPRLDKEHNPAYKAGLRDIRQFIDALPAQLVPADVQEAAEIRKINITPSEVRYIIDAIPGADGIFRSEENAKRGLAIFKAGMLAERERLASCPTIKGWVMRDKYGSLKLYEKRPHKIGKHLCTCTNYLFIKDTLFPDLREDEPKPVRVIIEEIKEEGK